MMSTEIAGDTEGKPHLAVVDSHPVQYRAPLYRRITERANVDLTVLYKSQHGVEPSYSESFGRTVRYDVDLLQGYSKTFLTNWGIGSSISPPWGQITPELTQQMDPSKFDAVTFLSYSFLADWIGICTARLRGLSYFLRIESTRMFDRPLLKKLARRELVRWLLKGAAGALPIGEKNREFYQFYRDDIPLFSSPYSVDNGWFRQRRVTDRGALSELTRRYGLNPDRPIVLFCGKLIERKRPFDILAAMDRPELSTIQALVVGDGPLREPLKKEAAVRGLRPRISLPGFVNQSQLPEAYSVADVLVLPSQEETWGLVANEAMNFGLPVVMSDRCGAAYDLVRDGITGFMFNCGNVNDLAKCISKAVELVVSRGGEIEETVLRTIDEYSLDRAAKGFERAAHFSTKREG